MQTLFILAALIFAPLSFASTTERTTARTSYGADVVVQITLPEPLLPATPVVILAPGSGYHMDLPILAQLADQLAERGVITYRFNWDYYTKDPVNGGASDELKNEIADMKAVITAARADKRIDKLRVLVAGKSLGSIVSYQVFQQDAELKALGLLTPVCTQRYDQNGDPLEKTEPAGDSLYPGLRTNKRPILMASSVNDPSCELQMFNDFLAGTDIVRTLVGGNHSWEVTKGTDAESKKRNELNVAQGVALVAGWISFMLN